jgi:hypothetical protein
MPTGAAQKSWSQGRAFCVVTESAMTAFSISSLAPLPSHSRSALPPREAPWARAGRRGVFVTRRRVTPYLDATIRDSVARRRGECRSRRETRGWRLAALLPMFTMSGHPCALSDLSYSAIMGRTVTLRELAVTLLICFNHPVRIGGNGGRPVSDSRATSRATTTVATVAELLNNKETSVR